MINKLRNLAGTVITAAMLIATPAHAGGVPVIDPAALVRIKASVDVATKQLAVVQQQVQQVQQMRTTIGQIGPGSLGKMLEAAGINFANPTGAFKDIGSLASQVQSISTQAGSLAISGEGSLSFAPIKDLATGREAAAKLFFYNGSDLSQQTISELRQRRGTIVRESALSGYGAAASMKADLTKSPEVAAGLSAQARDAADLRGDVQANTATMLAMYSELAKQTAIQAQLLEIESAQTLAADSVGRRSN